MTRIKTLIILSVFTVTSALAQVYNITTVSGQLISKFEMKESIEGICDQNEVYGLFDGYHGQVEAKCQLTKDQLEAILNEKIDFFAKNPKYKGKGMLSCFVSCKGITLKWEISKETKNTDVDRQVLEVFKSIPDWKPGILNGKNVDSRLLVTYKIKKGHLTLE